MTSSELDRFGNAERLRFVLAGSLDDSISVLDEDILGAIGATSKADLLADQRVHPPFGTRVRCGIEEITMIVESSGSSGGPREVHVLRAADEEIVLGVMAKALATAGVVSGDVVALTLPVGTAGGGAKMMLALRRLGSAVLRVGSSSTTDKVAEIRTYGATVVVGTPAYLDTLLAEFARQGLDPRLLPVRTLLVATQSMTLSWLRRTETAWGAKVHEWYGNAAGVFAMTGTCGSLHGDRHGVMHWDPDFVFVEVRRGGRLVQSGERGELIGTHLQNSTAPLVRFRTGDEGRFIGPGQCGCGSAFPGIESGTVCRIDSMMKIRGMNVWPGVVDSVAERVGMSQYWVLIETDGAGREAATLFGRPSGRARLDTPAVVDAIRAATGVGFRVVEWTDPDPPDFVATTALGKQRQWVDRRASTASSSATEEREPIEDPVGSDHPG